MGIFTLNKRKEIISFLDECVAIHSIVLQTKSFVGQRKDKDH